MDINDYKLPFFGDPAGVGQVEAWANKIASLDGFVFVTAEYNHSITAALKNALDSTRAEWYNKAAGIVSYGSAGGARAAEYYGVTPITMKTLNTGRLFSSLKGYGE